MLGMQTQSKAKTGQGNSCALAHGLHTNLPHHFFEMRMKVQKVKFNGLDFIMPDGRNESGPIVTIEAFKKGECSYAHFYPSRNVIMQFHQQIGTIDDIEFGEFIEIEVDVSEFIEGLCGNTWPF